MHFDFFSPIVPYIQIWACFDLILEWPQNEGLGMGHNITVLKNWSQKWIASVKKSLSQFEFIQIWPLFVSIYYDATRIVKFFQFQILEKWWKIKYFTLNNIHLLLFGRGMLLWNCFEEFGKVTSKRSLRFTPSSK